MCFSYWMTEASTLRLCNTYCLPRQQLLRERASVLCNMYIACLVTAYIQIYRSTFMSLQGNAIHGRPFCRFMNPFCRYGMTSATVNRSVSRNLHKITHTHTEYEDPTANGYCDRHTFMSIDKIKSSVLAGTSLLHVCLTRVLT
jgi:hypothetical protein